MQEVGRELRSEWSSLQLTEPWSHHMGINYCPPFWVLTVLTMPVTQPRGHSQQLTGREPHADHPLRHRTERRPGHADWEQLRAGTAKIGGSPGLPSAKWPQNTSCKTQHLMFLRLRKSRGVDLTLKAAHSWGIIREDLASPQSAGLTWQDLTLHFGVLMLFSPKFPEGTSLEDSKTLRWTS